MGPVFFWTQGDARVSRIISPVLATGWVLQNAKSESCAHSDSYALDMLQQAGECFSIQDLCVGIVNSVTRSNREVQGLCAAAATSKDP